MKQITQERILKALDKVSTYLDRKPEIHIMQALSLIGLKTCIGDSSSTEKERLELAYQGFTDPEQVLKRLGHCKPGEVVGTDEALKKAWIDSFKRLMEKNWQRQDKITTLQKKYNVSGLELETIHFGDKAVTYHTQVNGLRITESDLDVLQSEIVETARVFCNAVKKYNMTVWRWHKPSEDWVQVKRKNVLLMALSKFWATCHTHKYYVNQKELKQRGCAQLKGELNSIHDKLTWEFHIILGSELYQDDDPSSIWFCANLGDTKPTM